MPAIRPPYRVTYVGGCEIRLIPPDPLPAQTGPEREFVLVGGGRHHEGAERIKAAIRKAVQGENDAQ